MLVKIGDRIFDSNEEPIMLVLDDKEKEWIGNMRSAKRYCSYPEDYGAERALKFMEELYDK